MSIPANFNGNIPMIDTNDAVLLLIDHQSGLFQLVRDIELTTLRSHVTALAKVAHLAKIPTFTTASVPDGPNGPLIPEIHQNNPDATYIPRTGQINAWDNPAWVEAIEKSKRKTLLIAGTLTSVCMSFPTLSAIAAGYKVFTIIDASGNWSKMATDLTLARVVQAGAVPIDTYATLAEIMSTWNRPDAMDFATIMIDHIVPPYRALVESYDKAQSVQKGGRETKLDILEAAQAKH
ncbi:isochorismatase family protein [Candidatus Nitrotoga sp. M5]|uniref:isochorismatase family protein n=1 Tax=Candidatus Nitrotoga sp. M5 TaxID=2890409 RepID=UPI001EF223EE|nr:isochorismatase family protein [Candidatus Nitrotoga sp. M5]CAH1385336.1 putative hydrolase YcaC [Candidatus Nitrotoga sp. M5]